MGPGPRCARSLIPFLECLRLEPGPPSWHLHGSSGYRPRADICITLWGRDYGRQNIKQCEKCLRHRRGGANEDLASAKLMPSTHGNYKSPDQTRALALAALATNQNPWTNSSLTIGGAATTAGRDAWPEGFLGFLSVEAWLW